MSSLADDEANLRVGGSSSPNLSGTKPNLRRISRNRWPTSRDAQSRRLHMDSSTVSSNELFNRSFRRGLRFGRNQIRSMPLEDLSTILKYATNESDLRLPNDL